MKIKGDVFKDKKVKDLFNSEGYTQEEWRNFISSRYMLRSRMYDGIAYIITDGRIQVLNLR